MVQLSYAQVTFSVSQIPDNTPTNAEIYISGSFDTWSGGSNDYKLTNDNGSYSISLDQRTGTIEFKFTMGSWNTVEKGASGGEISNRKYTFGGNGDTADVKILNWAATENGSSSTASENVIIMSEDFEMPQFNRTRRIWLYLPGDY